MVCSYDFLFSYQWRVTNCALPHNYICTLRIPNCPKGYIYETELSEAPQYESKSCYKITEIGNYLDNARNKRFDLSANIFVKHRNEAHF